MPKNSEVMAERSKGMSGIRMIPGAGHAESVLKEPEMYKSIVKEFLKRCEQSK